MTSAPDQSRPRCPRCGARAYLVVAQHSPNFHADPALVITGSCGYVKGKAICRQPIALIINGGGSVRYAFPPDFDSANTLDPEELATKYSPAAVWAQKR